MSRWQEFPLRAQGRSWPGINSRSGKLDDGTGQMDDTSINCIINRGDQLAKRKGMIRGLDENFSGAVCGLHAYTDECGREWLLVADEEGISIRQPFAIPSFGNSDAYPSDDFQSAGPVDPNFWTNTGNYVQAGGSLRLASGLDGGDMRWFKDATNFSYQVQIEFKLDPESAATVVIKQSNGLARIEGNVLALPFLDADEIQANLIWINALGESVTLGSESVNLPSGIRTGTLQLSYLRGTDSFRARVVVQPSEGAAITLEDFVAINALADADLGQGTSLRLQRDLASSVPEILSVQGGPL